MDLSVSWQVEQVEQEPQAGTVAVGMQKRHALEKNCVWVALMPDPEARIICACLAPGWRGGWVPPEGSRTQGWACANAASLQPAVANTPGFFRSCEPLPGLLQITWTQCRRSTGAITSALELSTCHVQTTDCYLRATSPTLFCRVLAEPVLGHQPSLHDFAPHHSHQASC